MIVWRGDRRWEDFAIVDYIAQDRDTEQIEELCELANPSFSKGFAPSTGGVGPLVAVGEAPGGERGTPMTEEEERAAARLMGSGPSAPAS